MKHYIRSSAELNIYEKNTIDVIYEVPFKVSVFCSIPTKITPVTDPDGKIDEQALADYDSFATNVYAMLCKHFDVVDMEESDRSKTSWYFYLFAKNKDNDVATRFLIRLRLSDHEYPDYHDKKKERAFVEKKAQEYKRPKEKKYQEWKIKQITVNNKKYSSYDEAEDAIYDELEAYSKKMYNKGN